MNSNCPTELDSVHASCSIQFYRFRSFQGWTSDSTIERLHGRSVNPLPVTDMNKFFDDRPEGKSVEIVSRRWISDFSARFVPLGVATGMQLAKSYSKNPYNEEVQVYELTGGVELVPLLTTRRYCSRSKGARHIATDATRPGCTIDSYVLSWNSWNCCFQELLFVCISDFWFSFFDAKSIIREKVRYLLGFAFILEFWKRCEMNLDEILLNSRIFWINFGWNTKHLTKIIKN